MGLGETRKTVATGVEMFRKLLDEGRAGDNVGVLIERHREGRGREGAGLGEAREHNAAHEVQDRGVYIDEGRRREAYTVFQGIQAAVLFQDDGRDRSGAAS